MNNIWNGLGRRFMKDKPWCYILALSLLACFRQTSMLQFAEVVWLWFVQHAKDAYVNVQTNKKAFFLRHTARLPSSTYRLRYGRMVKALACLVEGPGFESHHGKSFGKSLG